MKLLCANRIAPDGMPRFAFCLYPMKRMPGLNELIAGCDSTNQV